MDSPLPLVLLVVSLLVGVSARPNENDRSTLNSTLESSEGNPTQDDAPHISARMTRQVKDVVEPEPVPLDPNSESAAKDLSKRITAGVFKVVEGALTLNMEKILRGSMSMSRSPEVRDKASEVLDSIFGNQTS